MKPTVKITSLAALLLGAAFGQTASAESMVAVSVHSGDQAGKLWPNNQPQNNNQRGAGAEHSQCSYLKTKQTLVCMATASYTDVVNATDVNLANTRIQNLCTAYKIDPVTGPKQVAMKYVTKNNSPDWQNSHKISTATVLGGDAVVAMYGYDPNGNNTKTYAQVIGANCENLSGTEFAQTEIIAKTNDDLGGSLIGAVLADSATSTKVFSSHIGNGNGQDDGWVNMIGITMANGKATITKKWDLSIVTNEERSRAECVPTADPDKVMCSWAEGNAQPPNRGVRVGLINVADGTPTANRILFKQYIKERQGNIMYSTPSLVNVPKADGTPSDRMILSYVMVDTTNRNGRNKGKTTQFVVPFDVTATGATLIGEPKSGILGLSDGAHPGLSQGVFGKDKRQVAFGWNPTITDGGTGSFTIMGTDPTTGALAPIKSESLGMSLAGGWISQYYGHNPNTPQGRNYAPHTIMIDNPGYGVAGGFQPLVEKFMVASIHGRHMRADGVTPEDKSAWDILLYSAVTHDATDPIDPGGGGSGSDSGSNTDGPGSGSGIGGCSSNGAGGSFGLAMFLGLAFTIRRRR
jgi:hypothetical protein